MLKEVDLMITVVKTRSGEMHGGEASGVVDEFDQQQRRRQDKEVER